MPFQSSQPQHPTQEPKDAALEPSWRDTESGWLDELWTELGRASRGCGPEILETKTAEAAAGADIWPELWFKRSSSRHQETRPEWKALPGAVNYIYMFSPLCCGRRSAS